MRFAFRIWNHAVSNSELNSSPVGQPFWDSLRARFGIFNNRSNYVEWGPELGENITLNQGQKLRGRDSADAVNAMVLSFDTPGFIKLIHVPTSAEIASFSVAGAVFSAASLTANGIPGLTNQLLNAGMQVKRSLIPYDKSGVMSDMSQWENNTIVAPNWMAYRAPGSAGHVSFYIDNDVPANIGAVNSCRVDSKDAPTNAGLRHWCLDVRGFKGKPVTLSAYVKGPAGSQCRSRVLTELGGEIANINFTGTGAWTRQTISLTMPSDNSRWLAYDSIFRPGHASATPVTWRVAAPQLNHTAVAMTFEPRAADLEAGLLRSSYAERFAVMTIGTSIGTAVNFDFLDMDTLVPKVKVVPDAGAAAFTTLNHRYGLIGPLATAGYARVMAAMLPTTAETA